MTATEEDNILGLGIVNIQMHVLVRQLYSTEAGQDGCANDTKSRSRAFTSQVYSQTACVGTVLNASDGLIFLSGAIAGGDDERNMGITTRMVQHLD
jgi:hypothetical protein